MNGAQNFRYKFYTSCNKMPHKSKKKPAGFRQLGFLAVLLIFPSMLIAFAFVALEAAEIEKGKYYFIKMRNVCIMEACLCGSLERLRFSCGIAMNISSEIMASWVSA